MKWLDGWTDNDCARKLMPHANHGPETKPEAQTQSEPGSCNPNQTEESPETGTTRPQVYVKEKASNMPVPGQRFSSRLDRPQWSFTKDGDGALSHSPVRFIDILIKLHICLFCAPGWSQSLSSRELSVGGGGRWSDDGSIGAQNNTTFIPAHAISRASMAKA